LPGCPELRLNFGLAKLSTRPIGIGRSGDYL
jgi:hypothetical protein